MSTYTSTAQVPTVTASIPRPRRSGRGRGTGAYDRYEPDFHRFGELRRDDPDRDQLRARLITVHIPVAEHIAQRYAGRGEPSSDLRQVAAIGLINAVDRYQPGFGRGFLPYAIPTIRGEVQRHFRDATWSMHAPRRIKELHVQLRQATAALTEELGHSPCPSELAVHLDVPVEDIYEGLNASSAYQPMSLHRPLRPDQDDQSAELDDYLGTIDDRLVNAENAAVLHPALMRLPDRERHIVVLRFFDNMTQTEIARAIGLSQMHVSRLLATSLARLRSHLATAMSG